VLLKNSSHIDRPLFYKARITGYDDKPRFQKGGTFNAPANNSLPLRFVFDTAGWPLGPYDGELDIYLDKTTRPAVDQQNLPARYNQRDDLEKARDGEFLYGLDPANNDIFPTHTPGAFAF